MHARTRTASHTYCVCQTHRHSKHTHTRTLECTYAYTQQRTQAHQQKQLLCTSSHSFKLASLLVKGHVQMFCCLTLSPGYNKHLCNHCPLDDFIHSHLLHQSLCYAGLTHTAIICTVPVIWGHGSMNESASSDFPTTRLCSCSLHSSTHFKDKHTNCVT